MTLDSSKPGEPLLLHDEPIYYKGKIIGETTSGNYSFNYNKNMSLGYVRNVEQIEEMQKNKVEIQVAGKKYIATINEKPLHDPKNELIKM